MSGSSEPVPYRSGENVHLDKEFEKYKRMRIWSGSAIVEVCTKEEEAIMGALWRKEKLAPRKLTVQDVLMLVETAERVREYRAAAEKENCRLRMEKSRNKLLEAAKKGDVKAIRRRKKRKESERKRVAKYRRGKKGKKCGGL